MIKSIRISEASCKQSRHWFDINKLHAICFPHDEIVNLYSGWWWVAYCESKLVAFCGMERCEQWCDCGYLCRAGVHPRYQGRGLQKRLIQVRINKAKRLGWNWLITDTTNNPASANNLIAKGFKIYQPSEPYAYDQTIYWRKKI